MSRAARRALALASAIALALTLALSPLVEVAFEHHDCAGDECVTCQVYRAFRSAASRSGVTPAPSACASLLAILPVAALLVGVLLYMRAETPVSRRELLLI